MNLAKEARRRKQKARKEKNAYDNIWIFFDNDNQTNLREAFQIITQEGFLFAYTSICIEFWFLIHYEDTARPFRNCNEVINQLKNYLPDYHKTKINHYEILENRMDAATARIRRIRALLEQPVDYSTVNPYSSVDELIEFIEDLRAEFGP